MVFSRYSRMLHSGKYVNNTTSTIVSKLAGFSVMPIFSSNEINAHPTPPTTADIDCFLVCT